MANFTVVHGKGWKHRTVLHLIFCFFFCKWVPSQIIYNCQTAQDEIEYIRKVCPELLQTKWKNKTGAS